MLKLPHAKDIRSFQRIRTVSCMFPRAKQSVDILFDCELSVCSPARAAEVFQGMAREFLCVCVCVEGSPAHEKACMEDCVCLCGGTCCGCFITAIPCGPATCLRHIKA